MSADPQAAIKLNHAALGAGIGPLAIRPLDVQSGAAAAFQAAQTRAGNLTGNVLKFTSLPAVHFLPDVLGVVRHRGRHIGFDDLG